MKQPVALIYDFDGTLTRAGSTMMDFGLLRKLGYRDEPEKFWEETNDEAKKQRADRVCFYMNKLIKLARDHEVKLNKEFLNNCGKKIEFRPGLTGKKNWFERINEICAKQNLITHHYIISSGLGEIIDNCAIAEHFKSDNGEDSHIFASRYLYDSDGNAVGPAWAVDYTTKTQFVFRINKGHLDIGGDYNEVNKPINPELRPIQFSNMIFFGDGQTDVPCFRLLKHMGGYAVALVDDIRDLDSFVLGNRIDEFSFKGNFISGGKLEEIVTRMAEVIAVRSGARK